MMLAFIIPIIFAQEEPRWWDYPGFELWKFLNLAVFVVMIVVIMRKFVRLPERFKDRKEAIKRELERAQQERDAAVAKLKEVEDRLARLDDEVRDVKEKSKVEAAEERERIAGSTQDEIAKLSEQATREIESAGKTARHQLRRYTAEQSVRLAEEVIRSEMKPEDDARLIGRNLEELGGAPQ